jgi:pimeloyl-ACP methyl ester carboxylesterase
MLLRRLKGDRAAAEAFKRFADGPSWDRLPESTRDAMLGNAPALMADLDSGTGEYLSDHEVHGLECAVLLLYGSEGPSILRRPIVRLAKLLPMAETRQVQGAGHLMHFDRPDEFVEAVLSMAR